MDLGFFRRMREGAAEQPSAALDFGMLTATLQAIQVSSLTARIQAQAPDQRSLPESQHSPLVELLLGGPGWKAAVEEQGGSFNRLYVRHGGIDA